MPEKIPLNPTLPPIPENIMPGAEPVFIDQGKVGILFLHGYTGSPYEGREFAYHFSQKGFGVWVPLLPGHGTTPEALETVSSQDWLTAAEQYYLAMKAQYDRVVVCGQSMGGALALHIAASHPVDALITLAAAIFIKDWRLHLLPVVRRVISYYYKSNGPDIHSKTAKKNSASYEKYPLGSLVEFLDLIEQVRGELPSVNAPSLLIHSRRDHTIDYDNLDYIYNHIGSSVKKTLTLTDSYHVISVDREKELIFGEIEIFFQSGIISASSPATLKK